MQLVESDLEKSQRRRDDKAFRAVVRGMVALEHYV